MRLDCERDRCSVAQKKNRVRGVKGTVKHGSEQSVRQYETRRKGTKQRRMQCKRLKQRFLLSKEIWG